MPAIIHIIVTREHLSKVRVKLNFVPAGLSAAKAHGMEDCRLFLGYHGKSLSIPIVLHVMIGCDVVAWLA